MMTLDQIMPTLPQMAPQGMFAGGGKLQNALMAAAAGFLSRKQPGMAQSLMQPLLLRQQRAFEAAQQQRQSDLETQRAKDLYDYKLAHPEPINNDTANDYTFWQQHLTPEQFDQWKQKQYDPDVSVPLPGGAMYIGPRSGMAAALAGRTPGAVAPPTAPVGKLTLIGGPTPSASGTFHY